MHLTIADLLASPNHFLSHFEGDQAVFLEMDRAAYARSIFVDRRIAPASQRVVKVGADRLAAVADSGQGVAPGPGWIFHIAHCGSTLLARALDHANSLVIREPVTLRQLGVEAANGQRGRAWQTKLDLAAKLLARRYAPDAPVIIKGNVPTNIIVPDLMAISPSSPAIFLHYPLENYLLAILRSPNHRNWVESVTSELGPALVSEIGDDQAMTPATRAAALWVVQMRIYAAALAQYPHTVSLDADALFQNPETALAAAFSYFGIGAGAADVKEVMASGLFATYSKNPSITFDNAMRLERQAVVRSEMASEISIARAWVESRLTTRPLPARLRPLYGPGVALLG